MAEDQLFFVGQKVIIEKDGEVLVLYNQKVGVDLPGGKIQEGETDFFQALKREVREETGLEIEVQEPLCIGYFILHAKHKHAGKKVFHVVFKAKYLSGEVILSSEHEKFEWVNKESYKKFCKEEKNYNSIINALKLYFSD